MLMDVASPSNACELKIYADAENPTIIIAITATVNLTFKPMMLSPF
jgi:hypothetical protein